METAEAYYVGFVNPSRDFETRDIDRRKANYIQQAFKEINFNSNLNQSISTIIKMYRICSLQYNLTSVQMGDLFVHVFEGPARNYFFNNIEDNLNF